VIVAELLGHARLETTRAYSRPTQQDAINALELLDVGKHACCALREAAG
jgi:integrase/recombinase XerC